MQGAPDEVCEVGCLRRDGTAIPRIKDPVADRWRSLLKQLAPPSPLLGREGAVSLLVCECLLILAVNAFFRRLLFVEDLAREEGKSIPFSLKCMLCGYNSAGVRPPSTEGRTNGVSHRPEVYH